jgi:hypothetical protein
MDDRQARSGGAVQVQRGDRRTPCVATGRAAMSARTTAMPELFLPDATQAQVEILGVGQQFVAYDEHPDTGRFSSRPGNDPGTHPGRGTRVAYRVEFVRYVPHARRVLLAKDAQAKGNQRAKPADFAVIQTVTTWDTRSEAEEVATVMRDRAAAAGEDIHVRVVETALVRRQRTIQPQLLEDLPAQLAPEGSQVDRRHVRLRKYRPRQAKEAVK